MQVTISIPQLDSGTFDTQGVKAYLARAEELGFEAGWVMEQSIGPTPLIAPLEMLAYAAAACTECLRLGVAVLVSSLHDPLQLASAVTAVDRLSHGRLEVGVSPGGGFRDFASFGVDRRTFVARFTEGLQLMKAAWSDEPRLTFRGQFRQLDDVPIQPKPMQRPHPPIWFGGSAPKALARRRPARRRIPWRWIINYRIVHPARGDHPRRAGRAGSGSGGIRDRQAGLPCCGR
jgi:alkanesulfonate monooxygenase SsuD/methylene tetrahydromethanopterin reductase-like flavin-dependent oxidoreductase (luciferase family)